MFIRIGPDMGDEENNNKSVTPRSAWHSMWQAIMYIVFFLLCFAYCARSEIVEVLK